MSSKSPQRSAVRTDDLIVRLSSDDQEAAEQAFGELRRRIATVKAQVYRAACRVKDRQRLTYLIELLGESGDARYFDFLARQLRARDAKVRLFAHAALLRLGTPEARELHFRCKPSDLVGGALEPAGRS